ncbi:MAG: DUF5666 domain-containing protein [Candidatus Doudnabacteria bacterium]|nr:DUF5666 domain-containing protein [Candidatus Doudnabacteria bacterium]
MNKKTVSMIVVIAIIVGAGSFFGGYKYSQAKIKTKAGAQGQFGQNGIGARNGSGANQGNRRLGNGNNFVNGKIISADANSITVQIMENSPTGQASTTNSNGSKIVLISNSSQITKSAPGTAADLTVGENVLVTGTANSDGSLTAQNIQIRPQLPENQQPPQSK